MSVITCPSCNTPAPPGAVFCDHCGYDLRTVAPSPSGQPLPPTFMVPGAEGGEIICPVCQHPNVAGSAFCENCGAQYTLPNTALKADRNLAYGVVVETMDTLNRLGVESLGMVTELRSEGGS